jgi:hypothetical protein
MAAHTEPSALPNQQPDFVIVGLDSHGNWIARDAFGTRGGIFVSCAAALRFARFEFGLRALPIVMSDGNIELEAAPSTLSPEGRGRSRSASEGFG